MTATTARRLLLTLLLCLPLVACRAPAKGEFAIYLADDVAAGKPIIATADIVSYTAATHEIELTKEARERLDALRVPMKGLPLAVCLGRQVIYTGAFWTYLSSQSYEGIVIMLPMMGAQESVRIQYGYPGPQTVQGEDPRGNAELMAALKKAGKLR